MMQSMKHHLFPPPPQSILVTLFLLLTLFSSFVFGADPSCSCIDRSRVSLLLVADGDPSSDAGWAAVQAGFLEGCKRLRVGNCTVASASPTLLQTIYGSDPVRFVKSTLDKIVAANQTHSYSAILTALPNPSMLTSSVDTLQNQLHIPVWSIHVGDSLGVAGTIPPLPTRQHIGSDETAAANGLAQKLAQSGVSSLLCVNGQADYPLYGQRCALLLPAFITACASITSNASTCISQTVSVHGLDSTLMTSELKTALGSTSQAATGIVLLSTSLIHTTTTVLTAIGASKVKVVAYGSSADILATTALSEGKLTLLVDDQSYTQGWEGAILATYFNTTGQQLANTLLATGPRFLSTPPKPPTHKYRSAHYDIIVHGTVSDPYWATAANGFKAAAADLDAAYADCTDLSNACSRSAPFPDPMTTPVSMANAHSQYTNRVWYSAPGAQFDLAGMSNLIDSAVDASGFTPQALSISLPDVSALGSSITQAQRAGIPISCSDSGGNTFSSLGLPYFVGQDEYSAGKMVGDQFFTLGVRRALCIDHQPGNHDLANRCQGFADQLDERLKAAGLTVPSPSSVTRVDTSTDAASIKADVGAALQANADVDCVLATGVAVAPTLLQLVNTSAIKLGTFDYDPAINTALTNGSLQFAIYQQPHFQSVLALLNIASLTFTGEMIQTPFLYSGPAFISPARLPQMLCEDAPVCIPPSTGVVVVPDATGPATSSSEASKYCPVPAAAGDKFCDRVNNIPGCWDGGDCCASTCGSTYVDSSSSSATSFRCGSDFFSSGFNSYACADSTASENIGNTLSDRCSAMGQAALSNPSCLEAFGQDFSPTQQGIMIAVAAFVLVVLALCQVLVVFHRTHRVIFSASPWFLHLTLVACIMTVISVILTTVHQTESVCTAQLWLFHLGFTLMLLALDLKTFRLVSIFHMKVLAIKRVPVVPLALAGIGIETVLLTLWTTIAPPQVRLVYVNDQQGLAITCQSDQTPVFAGAHIAWQGSLLIAGFWLSQRAKNLPSLFNESKQLALCFYQLTFLALLETLFYFGFHNSLEPQSLVLLQGGGILLAALSGVLILFIPKLQIISTRPFHTLTQPTADNSIINESAADSSRENSRVFKQQHGMDLNHKPHVGGLEGAAVGHTVRERLRNAECKVSEWAERCEVVRARVLKEEQRVKDSRGEHSRLLQKLLLAHTKYRFRFDEFRNHRHSGDHSIKVAAAPTNNTSPSPVTRTINNGSTNLDDPRSLADFLDAVQRNQPAATTATTIPPPGVNGSVLIATRGSLSHAPNVAPAAAIHVATPATSPSPTVPAFAGGFSNPRSPSTVAMMLKPRRVAPTPEQERLNTLPISDNSGSGTDNHTVASSAQNHNAAMSEFTSYDQLRTPGAVNEGVPE